MIILGIETTCDETGVGVVEDGRRVLSNLVVSSATLHKKYKGVVPEVAAREQIRVIVPVIKKCLSSMVNGSSMNDQRKAINAIDAIAVAYGPGLIGSLLVGVETVKTLALVFDKPLVPINHLMGHVYANWLEPRQSLIVNRKSLNYDELYTINDKPEFPLIALIVSGGHTDLILMKDHGKYRQSLRSSSFDEHRSAGLKWLGGTRDDAAGEAFDKVARVLGLGYPGGPEIEKVASQSRKSKVESRKFKLPRPMIHEDNFDFSFSGLKTAVVNLVNMLSYSSSGAEQSREVANKSSRQARTINPDEVSAVAFEFQEAIVDVLVTKTMRAAKKFNVKSMVVGGGVAANEVLRSEFIVHSSRIGIPVFFPSKDLSVDNGAMIAAAAFYNFKSVPAVKLQAQPGLYF